MNFTLYANPTLTLVCVPATSAGLYSLEAVADLARAHPAMLRYYAGRGLISPPQALINGEPYFAETVVEEVRQIEHFRHNLGASRRALPLLCALWRECEREQIELSCLHRPSGA
jgi:DNA-binding transcriptional MerR regulator